MGTFRSRVQTFVTPLGIALTLGRDLRSRAAIIARSYGLLLRIALKRRVPIELSLFYTGRSFNVTVENASDLAAIREVFLDEEYAHPHIENAEYIFDVGGNIGMASIYLACVYPAAQIHAFEPDPILFKKLQKHTEPFTNVHAHQLALADRTGESAFFTHPQRPLSGSLVRRPGNETEIIVPTDTLSKFARAQDIAAIDLVKFDIEGGEALLFRNEEDRAIVQRAIGEVHLDLLGMNKEEFSAIFADFPERRYVRQTQKNRYLFFATK